jgi:hypothetical protein
MRDIVLCSQWVNRRRYHRNLFFSSLLEQWKSIESVQCLLFRSSFFLGGVKDEYN